MLQRFDTRKYSIKDFEEWNEKDELVLAPKFQRREVWNPKARSYLIDTIILGKPIPKIYMRQDINPKTRRTKREIVDGQQRLHTVLSFLKDGFKISKTHNEEFGGKYFSELDERTQKDILKYEFVVDLLQDMEDADVYDVFARLNTYATTLNHQELRNARWFGEFKTSVYAMANEYVTFWQTAQIFSDRSILRMAEVECASELYIAMLMGIRPKEKRLIDNVYREYDDTFPRRKVIEKRFRETMDAIGNIMESGLADSELRSPRLFYPLYCAVYHLKFKLPGLTHDRAVSGIKSTDYPKLRIALEQVDSALEKAKAIESNGVSTSLSAEERRFYDAYKEHWVHAENRRTLTNYILKLMVGAMKK